MRTFVLILCLLLSSELYAQSDTYMHGTYDDVDWETLEFVGPRAAAIEKIYYNYPESRQGRITLRKQSAYRSKGIYYYTVTFPNISTQYFITLDPSLGKCTMRDERGSYYKEFQKSSVEKENNEIDQHPQQAIIQKVKTFIEFNGKYISATECDRILQYSSNGNSSDETRFSIYEKDMKFIFGDVNADGILDGIMNAPIIQCDGSNACCMCMEYIVALSQKSGKHLIKSFEFPNNANQSKFVPLRIEKNGSIFTKELYKTYDSGECRCCTSGERYGNYRFIGQVLIVD